MKLLIPELGTRLVLSKDWTFKLHNERRNVDVLKLSTPMNNEQLEAEISNIQATIVKMKARRDNYVPYFLR